MSDPSLGRRLLSHRWAVEPALAVVILLIWGGLALILGSSASFWSVVLCAAAVAFSRFSPPTALTIGAFAVLASLGYLLNAPPSIWLLLISGSLVVWGTSLYGGTAVRFTGLAAGLLLSAFLTVLIVLPAMSGATVDPAEIGPFLGLVGLCLLAGLLAAALIVGGWAVGLVLHDRAEQRGTAPAPTELETWLMEQRPDQLVNETVFAATLGNSRGFRLITRRQLSIDLAIAGGFFLFALMVDAAGGIPGAVVLIGFTAALAVRRLSPGLALTLAWLFAVVQMLTGLNVMFGNVAILAVLYATAAYADRVVRWAGLFSVALGAMTAAFYLALMDSGFIGAADILAREDIARTVWGSLAYLVIIGAVLGLSWTLGLLVRTWQTARESRLRQHRAVEVQRAAQRDVVVEQERNRIARDMHDVVAHSLAVVIAQADGARYARAQNPGAVDEALSTISSTAREALGDVRILLARLRQDDAAGPQPVLADLDRLVAQLRGTGLDIAWTTTGTPTTLGSGAQLAVYRIVQEALTNALRHGDAARNVYLSLAWTDGWVTVTIDNAITPDTIPVGDPGSTLGHGLPGMRERASLAGGTLTAQPAGGRFVVTARVPAVSTATVPSLGTSPTPQASENLTVQP
jgi:signal transduction histidine kinase